jgi:hypothetical protein
MNDILDDLRDLHKQATTEHSHYYVASVVERSIKEIKQLRAGRPADWPYFTRSQWFELPLALRKRWWEETNYGGATPSDDLKAAIEAALKVSAI